MTFEVGEYQAVEMLGAGGSAQVWLGVRKSTGARVALKTFPADRIEEARREAALAAAVDHPHVVRVLDVVADQDRAVLITEYAAGGDLADLLERRGRLTAPETLTVLLPLAAALATAHEREIVHGDLAAGNVVFDQAGRPLLADLGAGRAAAESGRPVSATPADAAPELARGGPPTPATDMFSLGSLALACLTGRHAWPADDLRDVLIQAAAGQWPDPGDDAAPPAMVTIIRALLEHDPERRPGAATVMLELKVVGRPEPVDLRIADPRAATGRSTGSATAAADADQVVPLHLPGRFAVDVDVDIARHRNSSDPDRVARSRAVTRRRADAVPPADAAPARRAGRGAGQHLRRTPGRGPARRSVRAVLLVTICLLVTGAAGAAGLWWAGWDRSEPVAVGGASAPTGGDVSTSADRGSLSPATSSATSAPAVRDSSPVRTTSTPAGRLSPSTRRLPVTSVTPPEMTPDNWAATVRTLDDTRAKALVGRDIRLLDSVYTHDATARSTDAGTIGTMLADGLRVSGAVHVTRRVRVQSRSPIRVIVEDSLPSYSIFDAAGRVVGRTAARAVSPRVLVLVATPAGYRISLVQSI